MEITQNTQQAIYTVLGIDNLPKVEQQKIINELGQAVFESALFQFIVTLDDWAQESFQTWVETHANDGDLLEKMTTLYPVFGDILTKEILALHTSSPK
jgi:hypothetical protein